MSYPGKLISVEGIEGCGKTTFTQKLAQALTARGYTVVSTKEPGGSSLGKILRPIVQTNKDNLCSKAEYLLFAADRAQHFTQIIIPALQAGKIVISDRMNDSSVAYQGYGRGLELDFIKRINAWAMNDIRQDLVFYLKLDIKTGIERIKMRNEKLTAFEQQPHDFWQRVFDGYEKTLHGRDEVAVLDARQSAGILVKDAMKTLRERHIVW